MCALCLLIVDVWMCVCYIMSVHRWQASNDIKTTKMFRGADSQVLYAVIAELTMKVCVCMCVCAGVGMRALTRGLPH